MKKIILLFAVLFIAIFQLAAQQLPFQGKLYQDGTPVNGMRNFDFEIESLGWTESHGSIQVTKGLYALTLGNINNLPANLFTKNERSRMLKVMVEGALLDEIMLYAPLEADGDPENELQALKMSGDTLHLTKGNFVLLNKEGGNISSTLSVGKLDTISTKTAQTNGNDSKMTTNTWQSFIPNRTGLITSVEIQFNNPNNTNLVLKIGKGEGNITFDNQFPVIATDFPSQNWLQAQVIQLDQPISVEAFEKYTFLLESDELEFEIGTTVSDKYPDGKSNFGATIDLNFVVNYEVISGYTFNVTEKGNVGIGVDEPKEKLEVAGRIKDKTGYVAPVGMIVPFAGTKDKIPEGWFLCDGKMVKKSEYTELWNVLGNSWGIKDGSIGPDPSLFKVPDLRGYFLRGVDPGTTRDLDSKQRANDWGGNTGNKVGSYQKDATKMPNTKFTATISGATKFTSNGKSRCDGGCPRVRNTPGSPTVSISGGDKQTNPINANVHYIIKY